MSMGFMVMIITLFNLLWVEAYAVCFYIDIDMD